MQHSQIRLPLKAYSAPAYPQNEQFLSIALIPFAVTQWSLPRPVSIYYSTMKVISIHNLQMFTNWLIRELKLPVCRLR